MSRAWDDKSTALGGVHSTANYYATSTSQHANIGLNNGLLSWDAGKEMCKLSRRKLVRTR